MGKSLNGKDVGIGIYQRKDGLYEGRYYNQYGQRKSVYAKTQSEAAKKLRQKLYEKDRHINLVDENITLDEWFDKWITVCKAHCRETTKRTYVIQYNRMKKELGWRKLTSLNFVTLQSVFNDMGSDKTRKDCRKLLIDILNRAVEADLLVKNPAMSINPVIDHDVKGEKRILSVQESAQLLEYSKGGMMYPILVVALGTGMRIGEILGLTWDCVDFKKNVIKVEKTLVYLPGDGITANYEFHRPKTKAGFRKIPMSKKVHDVLLIQKDRKANIETHFSPREGFEDLVFTSKTNNPLNHSNVKESINYIVDRINRENPDGFFEHVTPHGLRHTFATNCIENGMSPKVLQKIMGHNSLEMTMDLYCHVRDDMVEEEMQKVANLI